MQPPRNHIVVVKLSSGWSARGYVRCNALFVYLHSAGVTCRRFHMKDGGASCKEDDRSVMSAAGRQ